MPTESEMEAEITREYGPFPGVSHVHGVSYDGRHVWFAAGHKLCALDPESGEITRELGLEARAGTAFDGRYLYQLAGDRIRKVDPENGQVLATIPAPSTDDNAGLTWAEGMLWVGQHRSRKIHQIDPHSGAIVRTLESPRFVTGVTWTEDELWHGTWQDDESELRRIDPQSGALLTRLRLPSGSVTGLESDGAELLFCGSGSRGTVRAVKKPKRAR